MKLQMNKGTDSIGHGGVEYVVNNHTWQVEVPDHVGHVLLATGAGAVRIDLPEEPEPQGFVRVRHITGNPHASFGWRGNCYEPDEHGVLRIPITAAPEAASHGFVGIPEEV